MKTELSDEWKRRLVRDFKLPVSVVKEPHFSHFLDLSEDAYKGRTYHEMLLEEVRGHGSEQGFSEHRDTVVRTMVNDLLSSEAWSRFDKDDPTKKLDVGKGWHRETLYQQDYDGVRFLSLDMKKANFQVFKFLDPELMLGAETFEELLSRYTDSKYLMANKMFRQYLFGVNKLYPKRQARVQKHLMFRVYQVLESTGLDMDLVMSANNDELVVKMENQSVKDKVLEAMKLAEEFLSLTLEEFTLKQVHPVKPLFAKMFDDGSFVLKRVDKPLVPEVLRHLKGEEPNEKDRYFTHDARLSLFSETLY